MLRLYARPFRGSKKVYMMVLGAYAAAIYMSTLEVVGGSAKINRVSSVRGRRGLCAWRKSVLHPGEHVNVQPVYTGDDRTP